jgi:hypothetical protein
MTAALRHRCRNQHCRLKLPVPVENEHHAFCCRGCYDRFHHTRCRVCEADLRKQGRRGDAGRLYCRPPKNCRSEAQRWPEKYDYGLRADFPTTNVRSAHSTGLKSAIRDDRPPFRCLAHWWWGGDPENGDHSLYDKDGLTIARFVLEVDGRYHLRTPVAHPHMSWTDLDEAKRRAESLALMAIPLAVVDPKLAARVKRDNETPHPMGPPLNRQWPVSAGDAVLIGAGTKLEFKSSGPWSGDLDPPALLRRRP